jgi:hypothetical protein
MSSIWPADVEDAAKKLGGNWVKAEMFEGEGLTLRINKVEKVAARNPKYGATETDYLVKNEILEVGETFHFVFEDESGQEKMLDSKSAPLFIGMQSAQVEAGDWVKIQRTGKTDETRYTVEKVEAPESGKNNPQGNESKGLNPDAIDAAFDGNSPF